MAKCQYGGQAVIEGVMTRSEKMAMPQKTDREIIVEKRQLEPWSARFKTLASIARSWP